MFRKLTLLFLLVLLAFDVSARKPPKRLCRLKFADGGWIKNATEVNLHTQARVTYRKSLLTSRAKPSRILVVAIPAYRELWNLIRLVLSLSRQNVDSQYFQLVVTVNNSPEVARQRTEIFTENQITLGFLAIIGAAIERPDGAPVPLSPLARSFFESWLQESAVHALVSPLIEEIRNKRLNILAIDYSTQGIESNMGKIRNTGVRRGLRLAAERNVAADFVFPDADCIVSPDYVPYVMSAFHNSPVAAAFLNLDFHLETDDTPAQYLRRHILSAPSFQSEFFMNHALGFFHLIRPFGGPHLAISGDLLKSLGGFPQFPPGGEDAEISERIAERAKFTFVQERIISTADRTRPDGFIARTRSEILSSARSHYRAWGGMAPGPALFINKLVHELNQPTENPARVFQEFNLPFFEPAWERVRAVDEFFLSAYDNNDSLTRGTLAFTTYQNCLPTPLRTQWEREIGSPIGKSLTTWLMPQLSLPEKEAFQSILRAEVGHLEAKRLRLINIREKVLENLYPSRRRWQWASEEERLDYNWFKWAIEDLETRERRRNGGRLIPVDKFRELIEKRYRTLFEEVTEGTHNFELATTTAWLRVFQQATMSPAKFPGVFKKIAEHLLIIGEAEEP
jgi:hypothetical protein